MENIGVLSPAIMMLVLLGIPGTIFYGVRFYMRNRKHRSPFPEKFLRSPGESLKRQIEDISNEIDYYSNLIIIVPIIVYSIHITQSYFDGIKENVFRTFASVIIVIVIISICSVVYKKALKKRRDLKFGYDGEVFVGQQLDLIMQHGYRIFHDFPGDNFNIDYIAVGPSGVFSIETKSRRKPVLGDGRTEAKVIYDGNSLKFPNWTEVKPIEQAISQAKWLSAYLSKAVGETITAQPVVVIPGWFIQRMSSHGIPVINPKNFSYLLKKNDLSEDMIKRITHQLDQKCRDIEPNVTIEKY